MCCTYKLKWIVISLLSLHITSNLIAMEYQALKEEIVPESNPSAPLLVPDTTIQEKLPDHVKPTLLTYFCEQSYPPIKTYTHQGKWAFIAFNGLIGFNGSPFLVNTQENSKTRYRNHKRAIFSPDEQYLFLPPVYDCFGSICQHAQLIELTTMKSVYDCQDAHTISFSKKMSKAIALSKEHGKLFSLTDLKLINTMRETILGCHWLDENHCILACTNQHAYIMEVDTGKKIQTYTNVKKVVASPSDAIACILFKNKACIVINLENVSSSTEYQNIREVTFSADGKQILLLRHDNDCSIVNTATKEEINRFSEAAKIVPSPHSKKIVIIFKDKQFAIIDWSDLPPKKKKLRYRNPDNREQLITPLNGQLNKEGTVVFIEGFDETSKEKIGVIIDVEEGKVEANDTRILKTILFLTNVLYQPSGRLVMSCWYENDYSLMLDLDLVDQFKNITHDQLMFLNYLLVTIQEGKIITVGEAEKEMIESFPEPLQTSIYNKIEPFTHQKERGCCLIQ